MASKDNSPVISFFSFQDIITSITGIMFLVVIMLVLMVLQQSPAVSQQKSRELQQELVSLENELKQLQETLAQFRKRSEEMKKRIEELKNLRLETLPDLKAKWVLQLRQIDQSIAQMEEEKLELEQLRKDKIALREKNEILLERTSAEIKKLKQELVELDEEITHKEKIYKKFRNVIRFVWDQNNYKTPVLLECSETEISVNSLDDKIPRRTFTNYNDCLAYCRTFPTDRTYFILLLKPSSFTYGETFSRELQEAGFERGREILPDEQSLILGGEQK